MLLIPGAVLKTAASRSIRVSHRENARASAEVLSEAPMSVSEVISMSGLAPRDGSPVHLYSNGRRLMVDDSVSPGQEVEIGTCSLIESMVVSHISTRAGRLFIGAGELPDGSIGHVPGARIGESVWVVRHIQHQSRKDSSIVHAQCHSFNLEGGPYRVGDLVRARPTPDGANSLLFDPRTEEWSILLRVSVPENMDSEEVRESYGGLLWTIRISSIGGGTSGHEGVLVPRLTYNPRIRRGRN